MVDQGRDREGLESSRSPLTPCSKPPKSYALICKCWPGGEIKERMKFQELEFLHQKMVSLQLFAVPSNDFSSIVECVKSRTSEHKLVYFHPFLNLKNTKNTRKHALANLMLLKIVNHGSNNGTLKHAQISASS